MEMKNYEPEDEDVVLFIKSEIRRFIDQSEILSTDDKRALRKELGDGAPDKRFNVDESIKMRLYYKMQWWIDEQLKCVELWKEVAIKNASINNEPHLVADKAVEVFRKNFNLE